jgi:hypothetical protein
MSKQIHLGEVKPWPDMSTEERVKTVRELADQGFSRKQISDIIPEATKGKISGVCERNKIKSQNPSFATKAQSGKPETKAAKKKTRKMKPPDQNSRTGFNYSGSYNAVVREIISLRNRGVRPGIIMERFGINEDQLRGMCKREGIDSGFPKVKKKEVVPLPDDWKFHGRSVTTECQWDVSKNPNAIDFCGKETFGGSPFCHGHASLAYPKRK